MTTWKLARVGRHVNKNANCKVICTLQLSFVKTGKNKIKRLGIYTKYTLIKIALFGGIKVLFVLLSLSSLISLDCFRFL